MDKVSWWKTQRAKSTGVGLLILALIGGLVWFFEFYPYVSTDDARVAADLYRVAPDGVSGRVVTVKVKEGDRVKASQVVVELDHTIAQAQTEKAKAHAELAEKDYQRMRKLVHLKSVPTRDLDRAQASYEMAKAEYAIAQKRLDNSYLKSPVDGVVVQKLAEEGNIMDPGQTAVTVADVDHAWISANIEETSVGEVQIGQKVDISVDEGGHLTGRVAEIRAATAAQFSLIPADSGSGNFTKVVQRIPIKVILDPHPGLMLRVGESVEIKIRVH